MFKSQGNIASTQGTLSAFKNFKITFHVNERVVVCEWIFVTKNLTSVQYIAKYILVNLQLCGHKHNYYINL